MPFFDHMLQQLGKHAGFDLTVTCEGDLQVDGHHTVEDCGLALGQALREALGDKAGVRRFASIVVPLDEAAVEVALDLSGRTFVVYEIDVPYEEINGFDTGLLEDFVRAFAQSGRTDGASAPAVRPLAAPRLRGDVQSAREGAGRRVRADRPRWHPQHEGNPVTNARIAVLDYGSGNLHSVTRALAHVGAAVQVARSQPSSAAPTRSSCPGWATSASASRALRDAGFADAIHEAADAGRPVIGVCVGMQVLFEGSDEDDEPGLGILPGRVRRLPAVRARAAHGLEHRRVGRTPPPVHRRHRRRVVVLLRALATRRTSGPTRSARRSTAARSRRSLPRTACSRRSSTRRSRAPAGLALYENIVREVAA